MKMCVDGPPERLLNLYVDGELSSEGQVELFAHLSSCSGCRRQFNGLLAFRLAARQDTFLVPPAADQALFARIDRLRRTPRAVAERVAEGGLFGARSRRHKPTRAVLLAAVVLVGFALAVWSNRIDELPAQTYHVTEAVMDDGALYVIGPGLMVVDKKLDR